MIEQLNNPVWSALTSGNKEIGAGNDKARQFLRGISPFAGVAKHDIVHFQVLSELMMPRTTAAIFTINKQLDASPLKIVYRIDGYQMMYEAATPVLQNNVGIRQLDKSYVAAMLELTKLSPPGPFMEKTILFGGYEGIFDDDQS